MSSFADTEKEPSEEVSVMALARRPGCHCSSKCVCEGRDEPWKNVPIELQLMIWGLLDLASMMCLGLTSRKFHRFFHIIVDDVQISLGTVRYNAKKYPFDLRMQASLCGEYVLHGWVEFSSFQYDRNLQWHRPLGELIAGEKWLWKNLHQCGGCLVYKPDSAWALFPFEEEMAAKHEKAIEAIRSTDIAWYHSCCRRCRAKALLVWLEKKVEYFEKWNYPQEEEEPSVGLVTSELFDKDAAGFQLDSYKERSEKNPVGLLKAEYDTWPEIYEKMGI